MNTVTKAILFVTCIAGAIVLASVAAPDKVTKSKPMRVADTRNQDIYWNDRAIDSAIEQLRQGDVVLRMGNGVHSRILAHMSRKNKSFSHCGIVLIEDGYPYVYHCIGGEDNPDARIRRDSANLFFSQAYNSAIGIVRYRFSPTQEKKLISIVNDYYVSKPKFDLKFDLTTDDQLYCTEFVYKAINKASGDTAYVPTTEAAGKRYVSTDNLFLNSHAGLVWQVKFK